MAKLIDSAQRTGGRLSRIKKTKTFMRDTFYGVINRFIPVSSSLHDNVIVKSFVFISLQHVFESSFHSIFKCFFFFSFRPISVLAHNYFCRVVDCEWKILNYPKEMSEIALRHFASTRTKKWEKKNLCENDFYWEWRKWGRDAFISLGEFPCRNSLTKWEVEVKSKTAYKKKKKSQT